MNFKLENLFANKNPVQWALHTTMTAELPYLAALAAMQTGGSDIAGTLKNPPDVAFFHNKNSTPTCKTALKTTYPIGNLKDKMFPVYKDGQTFHAKLSLVYFEDGAYRLAVYSKNCGYASDTMLEVAALFDLSFGGAENDNSQQLRSFFAHLFDHTTDAGKHFIDNHKIINLFENGVILTEVPTSKHSPKPAQIFFGGCGGDTLSTHMDFDNINLTDSVIDSVILTPPAFMTNQQHPCVWDAISPYVSHAKLYLLQHNHPKNPHSLWLGSANCTAHGIGWNNAGNQSVECLVKFDLDTGEFTNFKNSLSAYYKPFDWQTGTPSLANKQPDDIADFFVNQCTLECVDYLDDSPNPITKLDSKTYVNSIKYEFSYDPPLPTMPSMISFFPLEYGNNKLGVMNINSDTVTVSYPVNASFRKSQGYLSVGVSGALIPIPIDLLNAIPTVDGLINLLNRPYLSEILSMEDEDAANYLTQCIAQLGREKEQAKNPEYAKRLDTTIQRLQSYLKPIQGGDTP